MYLSHSTVAQEGLAKRWLHYFNCQFVHSVSRFTSCCTVASLEWAIKSFFSLYPFTSKNKFHIYYKFTTYICIYLYKTRIIYIYIYIYIFIVNLETLISRQIECILWPMATRMIFLLLTRTLTAVSSFLHMLHCFLEVINNQLL